jgi:uncharacterized protein affecting Mg2+/Co2+ transport
VQPRANPRFSLLPAPHDPSRSIRFDLLPEEEQAALQGSLAGPRNGPLASVQLRSRHWLIRNAAGAVESEVRGEAVVGHYPLLRAGGPRKGSSWVAQREQHA